MPSRPSPWGLAWLLPLFVLIAGSGGPDALLGRGMVYLCAGIGLYVLYVRLWEHRPVRELKGGLSAAGLCALGVSVGVAVTVIRAEIAAATDLLRLVGSVDWHGVSSITLGAVVLLVGAAIFEEILYRGVILRYSELWLGSWLALGLSSLLFAAAHSVGAAQSPGLFAQRATAGLVFGAAYLLTRRLWLSIGIHIGLNLAAACTVGYFGITPIALFSWNGSPWLYSLWPVAQLLLAGILLAFAQRRGNLANRAKAWQLQCGVTIGDDPTLASDSSKDGASGLARAGDCVGASQQAHQAGSQ